MERFEQTVATDERIAVIGALLREWLQTRGREDLRQEIIEGCREMWDIYVQLEREFHPLEEEVATRLDP